MNQYCDSEKKAYFLFMKNHWARLKSEGLTTSFALTYLHNLWKSMSEQDKKQWQLAARDAQIEDNMIDDLTIMTSNLTL